MGGLYAVHTEFSVLRSIERIITHSPDQINLSRRDGYTPLHICAAQNFPDIVSSLAQHVSTVAQRVSTVVSWWW